VLTCSPFLLPPNFFQIRENKRLNRRPFQFLRQLIYSFPPPLFFCVFFQIALGDWFFFPVCLFSGFSFPLRLDRTRKIWFCVDGFLSKLDRNFLYRYIDARNPLTFPPDFFTIRLHVHLDFFFLAFSRPPQPFLPGTRMVGPSLLEENSSASRSRRWRLQHLFLYPNPFRKRRGCFFFLFIGYVPSPRFLLRGMSLLCSFRPFDPGFVLKNSFSGPCPKYCDFLRFRCRFSSRPPTNPLPREKIASCFCDGNFPPPSRCCFPPLLPFAPQSFLPVGYVFSFSCFFSRANSEILGFQKYIELFFFPPSFFPAGQPGSHLLSVRLFLTKFNQWQAGY